MKAIGIACAVVALAGCAPQHYPGEYTRIHGPEPTKAEIEEARGRMMSCFWRNAQQLDDQKSDAATIGRSVAGVCSAESNDYARRRLWASTEQQKSAFYAGWDKTCAEIATTAVLLRRRDLLDK